MPATASPRTRLLTQNSEMRKIGVWNWSIPAWAGRMADGRTYNTCPSAGVCRHVCYARQGTYRFPVVRAKHEANLRMILDDLPGWETAMRDELAARRFTGAWVRIHDAGDFFTDDYLTAWLRIMRARPGTCFYAYTKEIERFKRLVEPDPPANFWWVYSYGGTQDHLIDPDRDRVADVFPDQNAIADAGYASQEASDLLAVLGPRLVGVPANRIPHFLKKQGDRSFRAWQAADNQARDARQRRTADTEPAGRAHLRLITAADKSPSAPTRPADVNAERAA